MLPRAILPALWDEGPGGACRLPGLQRGFARGCCNALLLSESLCCDFSSSSSPLLTAELGLSVMGSEVFFPYFGFTEAAGCEKEREKLWQQQMLMSLLFSRATSGS